MSGVVWFRIESSHMSEQKFCISLHFFSRSFLGARQGMDLPSRVWSAETLDFGIHSVEEGLGMAELDERTSAELEAELTRLQDCSFNLCVRMTRA